MTTATKSMSMNSDKDNSINKDNVVVVNNDTTVVRTKKRQTAEKSQEKGQTEKERREYFDTMLENKIVQYTAKEAATENRRMKKQASIVDDLEDDEEVEESSLISGFEMRDPLQLAELITASNQVNTMCSPAIAISVSVENNKTSRDIAYDFFMTNK